MAHTILQTALNPNEAAELLGLSQSLVVDLVADGGIPAERLPGSSHRVLRLSDLLAFQAERERKGGARRAIMEIVEDEGLPY